MKWADCVTGTMLASASFDGRVKVWRVDTHRKELVKVYEHIGHTSQNCVDWAPTRTPLLAAVSSDGGLTIITHHGTHWEASSHSLSEGILTAVCWAPLSTQQILSPDEGRQYLVTVGCDKAMRISYLDLKSEEVVEVTKVENCHANWIRDVSWSSSSLSDVQVIATGSEDKTCKVWRVDLRKKLQSCQTIACSTPVWRVSWNFLGNLLAIGVTSIEGKNNVHVYRQSGDQKWEILSQLV